MPRSKGTGNRTTNKKGRAANKRKSRSPIKKTSAKSTAVKAKLAVTTQAITLCPKDLDLAIKYVKIRRESKNKGFKWSDFKFKTTRTQQSQIRKYVRENKLLPEAKKVPGTKFVEFPPETIIAEIQLPKSLWDKGDPEQFKWLDEEYKKGMLEKPPKYESKNGKAYTWHHHQDDGKMQLVEYGMHSRTTHHGGRETWATGGR